jgi:outer membrane protein TolC
MKIHLILLSLLITMMNSSHSIADNVYNNLSLKQSIEIGLANNIERKISLQTAAIAESQYQEALSAQWPSLTMQGSFQRRDEAPTFVFPSSSIPLGGLSGAISAALGGAPVPSSINVPEQKVKLFNRDTTMTSVQMLYPLYTGGKISSLISQANFGKEIAHEEMRRTSLQVLRDVKRFYYAAQLTRSLTDTARDTVDLLSATRDITKKIYEGGSSTVNKLDFLKTELAVSYAKSVEADFAARHQSAIAALVNAMGLPWDSQVSVTDSLNAKVSTHQEMNELVQQASEFNPQIGVLKLAIKVADAKIDEAKSGHLPQVALTADATHINNSYNSGLTNDVNRNGWTIGIGVSLPLFDGWRTTSQVNTAKLQREQIQQRQKLVEQGIATLVKNLFIEFASARQQVDISQQASNTASENADLTSRAFELGASKPQDVIEAHILQAIIKGNLFRAQHDQLLKLAEIDYVLGMERQLQ